MNTKVNAEITINGISINLHSENSGELVGMIRELTRKTPQTIREVTEDTLKSSEAIATQKKPKKHHQQESWTRGELEFMALMAIGLGPNATAPSMTMAKELIRKTGTKRRLATINAMAYRIHKYMRDGVVTGLAERNKSDMIALGFGPGSLFRKNEVETNMLGNVRHLVVQEA